MADAFAETVADAVATDTSTTPVETAVAEHPHMTPAAKAVLSRINLSQPWDADKLSKYIIGGGDPRLLRDCGNMRRRLEHFGWSPDCISPEYKRKQALVPPPAPAKKGPYDYVFEQRPISTGGMFRR